MVKDMNQGISENDAYVTAMFWWLCLRLHYYLKVKILVIPL